MIDVYRWYHDDCTIGRLTIGDFQCFTLELPWLDNQTDISCIPEGVYEYFARRSPNNGLVLELRNVEDRTNIQVHSGNFTRQILGCILVGEGILPIDNNLIPDVSNSRNTLIKLRQVAGSSGHITFH